MRHYIQARHHINDLFSILSASMFHHFSFPKSLPLHQSKRTLGDLASPDISISSSPSPVFGASKRYLNPLLSIDNVNEPVPRLHRARIPRLWSWFSNANTSLFSITPSRAPCSITSSKLKPSEDTPKAKHTLQRFAFLRLTPLDRQYFLFLSFHP